MSKVFFSVGVRALLIAAILVAAGWARPAAATLIGDTVGVDWVFPAKGAFFSRDMVVVGAGPEISCKSGVGAANLCLGFLAANQATFDISASSIRFDLTAPLNIPFAPGAFNGFVFSGLQWQDSPGVLIGYQLSTSFAGVTNSAVEFGSDFISINLVNEIVDEANEFFQLDLIVSHAVSPPVTAPEPNSAALLLASASAEGCNVPEGMTAYALALVCDKFGATGIHDFGKSLFFAPEVLDAPDGGG